MPPDPRLLKLANASTQLALLQVALLKRSQAAGAPSDECTEIELRLPLIEQALRDLERLKNVIRGSDHSLPMPSDGELATLKGAAGDLSAAIARDQEIAALIQLGDGVLAAVKTMRG